MEKILLACPVSEYKNYILPHWIEQIKKLSYPIDILLVDNSASIRFSREIKHLSGKINIVHLGGFGRFRLNELMAQSNNYIKKQVIRGKYDYLFSLECDVIPPVDVVERLLIHRKPLVSALYNIGTTVSDRQAMIQVLEEIEPFHKRIRNMTQREGFQFVDGTLKPVFGCGLGCVLIRRDIIERFTFRTDPRFTIHADTFFYIDLFERDIPVYVDTNIHCSHFNSRWNLINSIYGRKIQNN